MHFLTTSYPYFLLSCVCTNKFCIFILYFYLSPPPYLPFSQPFLALILLFLFLFLFLLSHLSTHLLSYLYNVFQVNLPLGDLHNLAFLWPLLNFHAANQEEIGPGQDEVTLAFPEAAVNLVHREGKDNLVGGTSQCGEVMRRKNFLNIEGVTVL